MATGKNHLYNYKSKFFIFRPQNLFLKKAFHNKKEKKGQLTATLIWIVFRLIAIIIINTLLKIIAGIAEWNSKLVSEDAAK